MKLKHDPRTPVVVEVAGAGRGAERMLPYQAEFNKTSRTIRLQPLYIDPVPGKAQGIARRAQDLGVRAEVRESTAEQWLASPERRQREDLTRLHVVAIDDPRGVARIVNASIQDPTFIYNVIDVPEFGLSGWRFDLGSEDAGLKSRVTAFYNRLADVTAPNGAREVFGDRSRTVNRLAEPRFRAWFADHFERNVAKRVHALPPETAPHEVTFDGHTTRRVELMDSTAGWRTPQQLLGDLDTAVTVPVRPGTDFAVVELGTESIRIHRVRYRVTDRRFAFEGVSWSPARPEDPPRAAEMSKRIAAFISD